MKDKVESARAITKNVRISPKKARLAAGLIRKKNANSAILQLRYSKLKGARLFKKTLDSAVANAKVKFAANIDDLQIKEVKVDEGPTMKRRRSKNRGGTTQMLKRTSHLTVVLELNK